MIYIGSNYYQYKKINFKKQLTNSQNYMTFNNAPPNLPSLTLPV